jgi:hypothetical protein
VAKVLHHDLDKVALEKAMLRQFYELIVKSMGGVDVCIESGGIEVQQDRH